MDELSLKKEIYSDLMRHLVLIEIRNIRGSYKEAYKEIFKYVNDELVELGAIEEPTAARHYTLIDSYRDVVLAARKLGIKYEHFKVGELVGEINKRLDEKLECNNKKGI